MAKIIGFGNRKGGAGKTTTANAFACYLAYTGKYPDLKIVGIDLDPMLGWSQRREDDLDVLEDQVKEGSLSVEKAEEIENQMFEIIYEPATTLPQKIEYYDSEYDLIILDLPGTLNQEGVPEVYNFCDTVIIPTDLTRDDLNGTMSFFEKMTKDIFPLRIQAGLPPHQIIGVLTKIDKSTIAYKAREEELKENGLKDEFGFEFIKTPITQAKGVFGQHSTTYTVLKNGSGQTVFTEVFEELVEKIGINQIITKSTVEK
jgi:chromosome partitioning protein